MEASNFSEVLHQSANNGVFHLPSAGREAMQKAVADAELVYHLVNLDDGEEIGDAFEAIAAGMKFPEYFGHNFDALFDCLTDLTWQHSASTVVVLTGCDALHEAAPEAWETLINVFVAAAEFWRDEDVPFWVFIDMRADGLAYLPTAV